MRIGSISAAAIVIALSGCASQEALVPAATAPVVVASSNTEITPQTKLHCHKEASIGSQMLHTVCETDQSQADRDATQRQLMNNIQANGGVHAAPGTGH